MIKVINESSENMEVEFAYFHHHVGMRKCSKEKAIQMVENFLNDMKNGSGYDIAGRGFAIYCTQSPDKYDGQMIYGRNDPHEFLDSLKESKSLSEDFDLGARRLQSIQDHLTGAKVYVGMKDFDSAISSCKEAIRMLEYEKKESMKESTDKYQFTLPFSGDEDLEYQRKVAKQLGLDFEFVDKSPEYMVFRGSKELLTKYCDTYGQNSKDIESVK